MFEKLYNAVLKGIFQKGPANWTAFHLAKILLNMPQEKIGNNIDHLDYNILPKAKELLKRFPEIKIISALRCWPEQDRLYAKGRTTPGNVVTNARAGQSPHNYGLAFDFMFKDDPNFSSPRERFALVGRGAEELGLKWGGHFGDLGHLEARDFDWKKLKQYFDA